VDGFGYRRPVEHGGLGVGFRETVSGTVSLSFNMIQQQLYTRAGKT